MRTLLPVVFSIFLISSVILISSVQNSYADEVIATSTGFEDSTILELKNSRGNEVNVDSVRIWLSGDNEFKSFKTEQGWMGKKQLNGVIEFTTQNNVKPGESVKFGIKTISSNPTINWKALDVNGEVISSASTKVTITKSSDNQTELNKPKIIAVKDESVFRFIPEKPAVDSTFRVVGENFVPNQSLDFYINNKLKTSVTVDEDGKILFTSKIPEDVTDFERTEFVLRDSGGSEKLLSIRISDNQNREIADVIKLSFGNTPQQVKRGDIVTLEGMATPNTTLTITSKHPNGNILNVDTIQVGFDGEWTYDNLFSPELSLGQVSVEITDGKSNALRNFEVISAKIINISSENTKYEPGDTITFNGKVIPNQDLSIIVEDSIGTEIISRSVSVDETGFVKFNIEIPRGSIEGTYVILGFQGNEEGAHTFGIGQEPEPILVLRPIKLNFSSAESIEISIQGPSNAQISIIIIDSADREKISDTINLGPDGKEVYKIESKELATGAYTIDARRGESSGSAVFTIGLTTGSGAISVQTTKTEYDQGDQVLILGNTGANNVLLDVTISNPSGNVVKKIETFSDKFAVFKVDNFRIPSDAESGVWSVNVKSGGNFNDTTFVVTGEEQGLDISLDQTEYTVGDMVMIQGTGARMSATVTLGIYNDQNEMIDELNITAKSNGEYSTMWLVSVDVPAGDYKIMVDDGAENTSIDLKIV